MWRLSYKQRVQNDLKLWHESGWVSDEGQAAILQSLSAHGGGHMATRAFMMMGVLLFGSGVITFFAANWQEMSKLLKLSILFGSMWLTYFLALYFGRNDEHPSLHHALLLLGVILFGANIMLVAQIYHIDHHYPDGVKWWAIGGLLTAILMRSQPVMVASLGLAILWGGMEQLDFDQVFYWPVLLFLVVSLPSIVKHNWFLAMKITMLGLLFWSLFTYWANLDHYWMDSIREGRELYLAQVFFLAYIALYLLAGIFEHYRQGGETHELMGTVRHFTAFAALGSFYMLTFPDLLDKVNVTAPAMWQWTNWAAIALLAALAAWRYRLEGRRDVVANYIKLGLLLLIGLMLQVILNLYLVDSYPAAMALSANLLYFALLLWLVFAGMNLRLQSLVNLAFFFFAMTLLTRYFDTFWTLMNRSFFFMGGGLILIVGGAVLERQRRRITHLIAEEKQGGEA